jgi:hypothetical protein
VHGNAAWTPQRLAWSALLMAVAEQPTLTERFAAVGECLQSVCPHWRWGASFDSWVQALHRWHAQLLPLVVGKLRQHMRSLAADQRDPAPRWEAFAVDGSDAVCPRTLANQAAASQKGQHDGRPLLSLTVLQHLELELPWSFRVGPSTQSERGHLLEMLDELPEDALLVADAGFAGYDCCRKILAKQRHFLLRVGGNVHLLQELGAACEVAGQTVYLWPQEQQQRREPPLELRLIEVRDEGKQPLYLLTSVLEEERLTTAEARAIYHRRWNIELFFRDLKQTLGHDGVLSRTPENSFLEMTWAIVGAWLLKLLALCAIARTTPPRRAARRVSVAHARNLMRRALRNARRGRQSFGQQLSRCCRDCYQRQRPKTSRNYPRKKRHRVPQPPNFQLATAAQRQLAQQLPPLPRPI